MNRELYDFALEVYERSIKLEDALDTIGFQPYSYKMTEVALSAILASIGLDEIEQTELRKTQYGEFLDYYVIISGEKVYTNSIINDIYSFVTDRPASEGEYQKKKENLWKMFECVSSGNKE